MDGTFDCCSILYPYQTPVEDVPSKSAEQQAELDAIRQQLHATEVQVLEAHKTNQDLMRVVSEYESALFRPSSVRCVCCWWVHSLS
jgi:hypothetical protein